MSPRDKVVFHSHNSARCHELWAVLDAAGIPADVVRRGGVYHLVVPEEDLERAVNELDDYRQEIVQERRERSEPEPEPLKGGWAGSAAYAAVIVGVAGLASRRALGADWFEAGNAQAGLLSGGEWWRAFTPLTLHVDAKHLLGNLVFGSILGFLASQGVGGGVAWFLILLGGALGNFVNALIQNPEHSAVGASTSVFAALGLVVALALVRRRRAKARGFVQRWSPLAAGLLLLAWTGIEGERTDVMAHVTGLGSGLLLGALAGWVPQRVLKQASGQGVAAALAGALVVAAWAAALS